MVRTGALRARRGRRSSRRRLPARADAAPRWRARRYRRRARRANNLRCTVAPTNSPAWPTDLVNGDHFLRRSSGFAAVAGYPLVTVPAVIVRAAGGITSWLGLERADAHQGRLGIRGSGEGGATAEVPAHVQSGWQEPRTQQGKSFDGCAGRTQREQRDATSRRAPGSVPGAASAEADLSVRRLCRRRGYCCRACLSVNSSSCDGPFCCGWSNTS